MEVSLKKIPGKEGRTSLSLLSQKEVTPPLWEGRKEEEGITLSASQEERKSTLSHSTLSLGREEGKKERKEGNVPLWDLEALEEPLKGGRRKEKMEEGGRKEEALCTSLRSSLTSGKEEEGKDKWEKPLSLSEEGRVSGKEGTSLSLKKEGRRRNSLSWEGGREGGLSGGRKSLEASSSLSPLTGNVSGKESLSLPPLTLPLFWEASHSLKEGGGLSGKEEGGRKAWEGGRGRRRGRAHSWGGGGTLSHMHSLLYLLTLTSACSSALEGRRRRLSRGRRRNLLLSWRKAGKVSLEGRRGGGSLCLSASLGRRYSPGRRKEEGGGRRRPLEERDMHCSPCLSLSAREGSPASLEGREERRKEKLKKEGKEGNLYLKERRKSLS